MGDNEEGNGGWWWEVVSGDPFSATHVLPTTLTALDRAYYKYILKYVAITEKMLLI